LWGGKYDVPAEEYRAVPLGWEASALVEAQARLGGEYKVRPRHKYLGTYPFGQYIEVLNHIADGIQARDIGCIELAVRFIESRFIHSYSGYIRARMARRLKHVPLSNDQRRRLSAHFLHLLKTGDRCHEFREYLRLWRLTIQPMHMEEVEALASSAEPLKRSFVVKVLAMLKNSN
jgi:hypothetical protein